MSDLVGNPEDRFSRVVAHLISLFDVSPQGNTELKNFVPDRRK